MKTGGKKNITIKTASGKIIEIEYRIIAEETDGVNDYGISVHSQTDGEWEHIRAITPNEKEINELLDLLARSTVTPATARDVVYDWLTVRDELTVLE